MIKFEVGQQFPLHNRAKGIEETIIDTNQGFFDVCFYSAQADEDVKMFTKGGLKYGLYVEKHIPFFTIEFDEMSIDASLNFLKVSQDKADDWLNSEANSINLYLIDAKTNILKGMRFIGIQKNVADGVRDTCELQDSEYATHGEVNDVINQIVSKTTTAEMINRIKMYRL